MDLTPLIIVLSVLLAISGLASVTLFVWVSLRIRRGRRELKASLRDFHSNYGYDPFRR